MQVHESGENYLETILILERRRGQVRSVGENVRLKGKSGGVEVLELEQLERSGIPDLPKEDVE